MKNFIIIELETPDFLEPNLQKFLKENNIWVEPTGNSSSQFNCPTYNYGQRLGVLEALLRKFWHMEYEDIYDFLVQHKSITI